jgi:hypothetical protein
LGRITQRAAAGGLAELPADEAPSAALLQQGPGGVSSKRGQPPGNHRFPRVFREHVLALVREQYAHFGPTLAREKLLERHGLYLGVNAVVVDATVRLRQVGPPGQPDADLGPVV